MERAEAASKVKSDYRTYYYAECYKCDWVSEDHETSIYAAEDLKDHVEEEHEEEVEE